MRACGGCNIHGSGARWMDRFFLLHVDFHIWVIKFIIWLAAALACDYSGYGTQGALLYVTCGNKGGSRPSPESLCGCWKKNCSVWLLWSGTVFSFVYRPSFCSVSPPFLPNPSQTFLPDSFVCQDPGYHGYQLALYEHLIPHLNIPSYLW